MSRAIGAAVAVELGNHNDGAVYGNWVNAVAVLPDGRVVSGGGDGRVRLWDLAHPGAPVELGTHNDRSVGRNWVGRPGSLSPGRLIHPLLHPRQHRHLHRGQKLVLVLTRPKVDLEPGVRPRL